MLISTQGEVVVEVEVELSKKWYKLHVHVCFDELSRELIYFQAFFSLINAYYIKSLVVMRGELFLFAFLFKIARISKTKYQNVWDKRIILLRRN